MTCESQPASFSYFFCRGSPFPVAASFLFLLYLYILWQLVSFFPTSTERILVQAVLSIVSVDFWRWWEHGIEMSEQGHHLGARSCEIYTSRLVYSSPLQCVLSPSIFTPRLAHPQFVPPMCVRRVFSYPGMQNKSVLTLISTSWFVVSGFSCPTGYDYIIIICFAIFPYVLWSQAVWRVAGLFY